MNGRVTEQMCDLLTEADYRRYGHRRFPYTSKTLGEGGSNKVACSATGGDWLTLALQPTAEAAKIEYAGTLRDHKRRMQEDQRQTILVTNVVPGADESWFDYATLGSEGSRFKEHEIQVRRGALLFSITLSGIRGEDEQDPKTVLTGLAGLVLQRLPGVGAKDTGRTLTVAYELTGQGRAKTVSYFDSATGETVSRRNVKLPWHVELPFVPTEHVGTSFQLNAQSANPTAGLGCRISVGGKLLAEQNNLGLVFCMGNYNN
ncbi:MmpS family transport accessory protein [Thermomonospora echinospora]|uniref:MmpS family transport accessory protein n=1 Tax=Thermomonospora echinospora TaxID=1992 RepID=UPI000CDE59AC|nr:MmpS family transport accessory protein [Thermomonospora echinospora]